MFMVMMMMTMMMTTTTTTMMMMMATVIITIKMGMVIDGRFGDDHDVCWML